jgi:hypothetical protein
MKNERDWEVNRIFYLSIRKILFYFFQKINLNNLFEKSLIRNQIDFVQLFLDHDFSLDDLFKNNNKLLMLYKNEIFSLKDDDHSIDPLRIIYTQIIQPIVGNIFDIDAVLYSDQSFNDEIDNSFTSEYDKHIHTRIFHRFSQTKTQSKGLFYQK